MTSYSTRAATIGDVTVTVSKAKSGSAADRLTAFLEWLGGRMVDPGYGVGAERPDNTLPPGVDNTLPGSPPKPDNALPGSQPGVDNTLPGADGSFLKDHAKEIAAAILKGTACDPAQPK